MARRGRSKLDRCEGQVVGIKEKGNTTGGPRRANHDVVPINRHVSSVVEGRTGDGDSECGRLRTAQRIPNEYLLGAGRGGDNLAGACRHSIESRAGRRVSRKSERLWLTRICRALIVTR